MKLLFVHGWGFDAGVWGALAPLLPGGDHDFDDRGYFGAPSGPFTDRPCLAVAHSFGAMRVLARPPAGCLGLVAINGFERFAARDGLPGEPPRVLDRMIARFAAEPEQVLDAFRRRCGAGPAPRPLDTMRLGEDLAALRDDDRSAECARWGLPLLSLGGGLDPFLPAARRGAAFAQAASCTHLERECGGHLMPLSDPQWCAEKIMDFIGLMEPER